MPAEMSDDLLTLASDVRLACQRVSRRVRYDASADLAPHQVSVLVHLTEARTAGELAAIEHVSAPSMTRTLNGLADAGLVLRCNDPADGRRQLVTLTDAGRAALERTRRRRDTWMVERLAGLTASELRLLRDATDLLERVIRA